MCGVIGIIGSPSASKECYQGLLLMQHRGQDAAGILSFEQDMRSFHLHKKPGLVDQVFQPQDFDKLAGNLAIGHTRYSTIGHAHPDDIQPIIINFPFGIGLAHNGNLVNIQELKKNLREQKQRYIYSNNDAEVLLNIIADELNANCERVGRSLTFELSALERAVERVFQLANGGYSVVGEIANEGLYAFRDPNGIRPLVLGSKVEEGKTVYCVASESNALNFLGYAFERDIQPGELLFIDFEGKLHSKILIKSNKRSCMFEWIYFANPDTTLENVNVYSSRIELGKYLGKKVKLMIKQGYIQPDIIVPIPETSRVSAIALSEVVNIPYRELLIKNRYIQRSFILNTPESRKKAVQLKLSPIAHEMKGKKVLLVDDSIVRGTTSKRIIELVRNAGAKEVYFASACPPILHPCFYGIDFPNPKELVATDRSFVEIKNELGADNIIYLDLEDLPRAIGNENLCMACLDNNYPTNITQANEFTSSRVTL